MYAIREFNSLYDGKKASWHAFRQGCIQMVAILMIFLLQQLVLYYTVYFVRNEKRILYILALDIIIALYLLSGTISTKGLSSACISVQWCLCCTSTVIKLIAILFSPNNADVTVTSEFDRLATEDYLSFVGFYPTPVIYILFNRISNRSLFNRERGNVNVDELLHSDFALTTAIDLWDIVLMLNHLIRRYRIFYESTEQSVVVSTEKRYFLAFGIICLSSTFLLGLISPTVDSDLNPDNGELERRQLFWDNLTNWFTTFRCRRKYYADKEPWSHELSPDNRESQNFAASQAFKAKPAPKGRYLDMFTIAKFTFLVGFFLIDLPFFVYRVIILHRENVFSLLLYKNLLGLFIRPYRLNLSQLAERDSAKGWQSAFFDTAPVNIEPDKKSVIHDDLKMLDVSSDSEADKDLGGKHNDHLLTRRAKSMTGPAYARAHTRSIFNIFGSLLSRTDSILRGHKHHRNEKSETNDCDGDNVEYYAACDQMLLPRLRFLSTRKLSADNEATSHMSARYSAAGDFKEYKNEHLDSRRSILLRMLNRHRDLPIKTFDASLMCRKWFEVFRRFVAPEPNFDMDSTEFLLDEQPFAFLRILVAIAIVLIARVIILVYCYTFGNDVRPPRFIFSHDIHTVNMHELVVYGVVLLAPILQSALFVRLQGCTLLGCLMVVIKEVVNLCSYVTCVSCLRAIADKPYSTIYAVQLLAFLLWPLSVVINILVQWLNKKLNLVRLIYMVCKHGICPVSLNHKLFCLDMIKSTTIADLLLHSQWNYFTYSALFRILCCSFSPTKTGVVLILVDLFIRFVYIIFCQTMRALMFRKFEVHYMILRLTNNIKFNYQHQCDQLAVHGDAANHFITHADVDEYIKEHGLLSSPGIIFPVFL